MKNITILVDYRGAFCSNISSKDANISMDVATIDDHLRRLGYDVSIEKFVDVDFTSSMDGRNFIYTSSEDGGLLYKGYIEDIVLALQGMGATVLPRHELLRAHHNKAMMELLRYRLFPEEAKALGSVVLGAREELDDALWTGRPKVIKAASGAGAQGVFLARTHQALNAAVTRLSRSRAPLEEVLREHAKRRLTPGWHPRSLHRNKVIVQNLIEGLPGDFKVLCFSGRYYVLYRANRPNDFRASGSGIFSHEIPEAVNKVDLLNYAEGVYDALDTPTASLDIGYDGRNFHLLEFQALHFGTLTAESSAGYHHRDGAGWGWTPERCDIEAVYAYAVHDYLQRPPRSRLGPAS